MSAITAPAANLEAPAKAAGLTLLAVEPGTDFSGTPTTRATLALAAEPSASQGTKTLTLELSEAFDASNPKFAPELTTFFAESAQRLRNPRPDCYLTLLGMPLSFGKFAWPFHGSTSGADTYIVHGEVRLEDGKDSPLNAKISGSLTQTFATIVTALEQPFAEGFIYNAVRKTFDQGQLELVKSGNRQPVPVTTRYYSMKQQRFIFNDTTPEQRYDFLAAKTFWLSHVLGSGDSIWIADPRDAQYLNTTTADLQQTAAKLAAAGLIHLNGDWASATPALAEKRDEYEEILHDALEFIKPSFNEDMRAGHTNM